MPAQRSFMKLRNLGETGFIRKIRERFPNSEARLGIGDDAAVFDVPQGMSVIYCSDLVAENTHFIRNLHPADSIAYKAVAVNVSDVGAMGGIPKYFTLSIALPGDLDLSWIDSFLDGLARACKDFNVTLLGGDSSSAERIFIDVSMMGWIETGKEVRRSGAKPGDGIYVTGTLGASAMGLDELRAGNSNHPSVARHLYPNPRHEIGRAIAAMAHAMMDISDGLSTDLHHIVEESNVSARIDKNRIPAAEGANDAHILHGGEDYELLIVAQDLPKIVEGVPITRIGEITASAGNPQIVLVDNTNESLLEPRGYEHFRIG
jgi:thiamine-monophosphate kinase